MGIFWSILGYPDESIVDPITGLTGREKRLIRSTKNAIMINPTETGAAVLYTYFEKYPDQQKLFPFKDVPLSELKANKKFKVHCNSVMYSIISWIDNLENPEIMMGILSKVGSSHERHKLPDESFWNLREVILQCLKPTLNKETYAAYEKWLTLAMKTITAPSS